MSLPESFPDKSRIKDLVKVGIRKVSSVIDGNDEYDAIIGHKISKDFRDQFCRSDIHEDRCNYSIEYIEETIINCKKASYRIPRVSCLLMGRTRNNIREFEWILEKIQYIDEFFTSKNIIDLKMSRCSLAKEGVDEFSGICLEAFKEVLEGRSQINPGLIYQLGQFICHFYRYLISLSREDSYTPLLAIVSNDHSPNPVAFSLACKAFNVPRVYVQHAEVSDVFPPLDFEFSVLRNEKSRLIYKEIGDMRGEVFVISRFKRKFLKPNISTFKNGNIKVGVYTTGRTCIEGLRRVLMGLQKNPNVSSVFIKPHPSQADLNWPSDAPILLDTPDFKHVAIVANSSVVTELLCMGIPVFQNFDFDPVERDYYGFVGNGIVKEVSIASLSDKFWEDNYYDDDWIRMFRELYAPEEKQSEKELDKFLNEVSRIISKRKRPVLNFDVNAPSINVSSVVKSKKNCYPRSKLPKYLRILIDFFAKKSTRNVLETAKYIAYYSSLKEKQAMRELRSADVSHKVHLETKVVQDIKWVAYTLSTQTEPVSWMRLSLKLGQIESEDVIRAVESLYADRDVTAFAILDSAEKLVEYPFVYLWLVLRKMEISGTKEPYEFDALIEDVISLPNVKYVKATIEGLAFGACLRRSRLDLLNELFEKGFAIKKEKLSTTRKISLLRYYLRNDMMEEYDEGRKAFLETEPSFHCLKIFDLDATFNTAYSKNDHFQTETAFELGAPDPLKSEFKLLLKPTYSQLRSRMRFMDVRSNRNEVDDFFLIVRNALQAKCPFSNIRLSDGEGYAFSEKHEFFTLDDQLNRERHWWGVELDEESRETIMNRVRNAAYNSDIIGIPSIHRFVRDTQNKTGSFVLSIQGRGMVQVLNEFANYSGDSLFGEEKMNDYLFEPCDRIHSLIKNAEKCVVVSSADVGSLPKWLTEEDHIKHIKIPTHFRTNGNSKYSSINLPLPLIYEEIDKKVREQTTPGTLVLVAGGIIGKIFINTAKEAGGVALDLGSSMDKWLLAGIHSLH